MMAGDVQRCSCPARHLTGNRCWDQGLLGRADCPEMGCALETRAPCLPDFFATALSDNFIRAYCQSRPSHELTIVHCLWSDLP